MLRSATKCGNLELIEYLVQKGADWNSKDEKGCTSLHIAAKFGHEDIVEFFCNLCVNKCDLDVQNNYGETSLFSAVRFKHDGVAKFLIESGADVEVCPVYGRRVLHLACLNGWLDIVQTLVNKKCHVNVCDERGDTPLAYAAYLEYRDVVEFLIESGASVNSCNLIGWTVLHFACHHGWLEIMKDLIRRGADVNAVCSMGYTPLHTTTNYEWQSEIINYLLEAGANWKLKLTDSNDTAFSYYIKEYPNPKMESIISFVKNGAYLEDSDYLDVKAQAVIKDYIQKNAELCTQIIINKFNNKHLPAFYELPMCGERLPPIEKLRMVHGQSVTCEIGKSVERDIEAKGFYDLKEARPTILKMLCIKFLIDYFQYKLKDALIYNKN